MKKRFCVLGLLVTLCGAVYSADDASTFPGTPVTWTTADGVRLVGRYHAASPHRLVWILLAGLGSNKQEWFAFVRQLTPQGDGFLIYDARGHGESTHLVNGGTLTYTDFKTAGPGSQWDHMTNDLKSAVEMLKKQYSLDPHEIPVGGASLGANVALVYASEHSEAPALILLSPGLEYAGIGSEEPFRRYGTRPVFIAASPGDLYASGSVRQLILHRTDPACRVVSGDGAAHGVNMFNPIFTQKLLDWMKTMPTH